MRFMVISNARPPPLITFLTFLDFDQNFFGGFMKLYITLLLKDFAIPLPPLSIEFELDRILDITHALVDAHISFYTDFKE